MIDVKPTSDEYREKLEGWVRDRIRGASFPLCTGCPVSAGDLLGLFARIDAEKARADRAEEFLKKTLPKLGLSSELGQKIRSFLYDCGGRVVEEDTRDRENPCDHWSKFVPGMSRGDCCGDGHYRCPECREWAGRVVEEDQDA